MLKLIIWDLDDTLWHGTLADGDAVVPMTCRLEMVRAFNRCGVVSSICSKNDFATARARLTELGVWDEFVFAQIAFEPKPQAVAQIIADMQLRPADVLFVDDNPLNLNEVRFVLPDIQLLDATAADADTILADLLAKQTGTRSRVAQYRALAAKRADRIAGAQLSDTDFLRACGITVAMPFCMETLDHVDRIAEMVNRSNQLNYTGSRVTVEGLRDAIIDVMTNISVAVFAWDRYGDYGLVGFVMLRTSPDFTSFSVVHFVFSCRAMHMGLESYVLDHIPPRAVGLYPPIGRIDHPSFTGRFDRMPSDWVAVRPVDHPDSRLRLLAQYPDADAPVLRIMCNCQSGGLAHFSTLRAQIQFDSFPDIFRLKDVLQDDFTNRPFPPFIVYGAGTDYFNVPWGDLFDLLDAGLYQLCVHRFARCVADRGIEMLVLLPPEDLPAAHYRLHWGQTPARIRAFNQIWRDAFDRHDGLTIGELARLQGPDELYDMNHHHPAALRKVSALIDYWYAQVSGTDAVRAAA